MKLSCAWLYCCRSWCEGGTVSMCVCVCVCVHSYINFNVKCLNKVLSLCTRSLPQSTALPLLLLLSLSFSALTSLCQGHFYACRSRRTRCCCYYCSCLSEVEISLNDRQHDADLIINTREMGNVIGGKLNTCFTRRKVLPRAELIEKQAFTSMYIILFYFNLHFY